MTLDGRSFWPQCGGAKGSPRDWWYCWYAPYGEMVGEFAATSTTKLYRDGRVFDLAKDPDEEHALPRAQLPAAAAADIERLQHALEQYEHARPTELGTPPPAKRKRSEED